MLSIFGVIGSFIKDKVLPSISSTVHPVQGMGKIFGRSLIRLGHSVESAARTLQKAGMGYKPSVMKKDLEKWWNTYQGIDQIRTLKRREKTPLSMMVETELKGIRNYRVHGVVTYKNRKTGETFQSIASFYTDENLSESDSEYEFRQQFEDRHGQDYEIEVKMFSRMAVWHNVEMDY